MKEYEISYNNKIKGKVKLFNNNLNKNIKNSLITTKNNIKYNIINHNTELQQYEVTFTINEIDDLYDIVSKYKYNEKDIFNELDKIKEYNNIKNIKKNTNIKIIISEIHLNNFNISKNNIDLESLFKSKIYFIKKVLENNQIENILTNLNTIINNYNNFKYNNEYQFLTEEEIENKINEYINNINKLIEIIENNTKYKYGKDFIYPIKINK